MGTGGSIRASKTLQQAVVRKFNLGCSDNSALSLGAGTKLETVAVKIAEAIGWRDHLRILVEAEMCGTVITAFFGQLFCRDYRRNEAVYVRLLTALFPKDDSTTENSAQEVPKTNDEMLRSAVKLTYTSEEKLFDQKGNPMQLPINESGVADFSQCVELNELVISGNSEIKKLIVPDGVEIIKIENCSCLADIDLSNAKSLRNINIKGCGIKTFTTSSKCESLEKISLANCTNLTNINIPNAEKLNSIRVESCGVKSLTIPKSNTLSTIDIISCGNMIGLDVSMCSFSMLRFYKCCNFKTLSLPQKITKPSNSDVVATDSVLDSGLDKLMADDAADSKSRGQFIRKPAIMFNDCGADIAKSLQKRTDCVVGIRGTDARAKRKTSEFRLDS
jgi:hypothetical protein